MIIPKCKDYFVSVIKGDPWDIDATIKFQIFMNPTDEPFNFEVLIVNYHCGKKKS